MDYKSINNTNDLLFIMLSNFNILGNIFSLLILIITGWAKEMKGFAGSLYTENHPLLAPRAQSFLPYFSTWFGSMSQLVAEKAEVLFFNLNKLHKLISTLFTMMRKIIVQSE